MPGNLVAEAIEKIVRECEADSGIGALGRDIAGGAFILGADVPVGVAVGGIQRQLWKEGGLSALGEAVGYAFVLFGRSQARIVLEGKIPKIFEVRFQ